MDNIKKTEADYLELERLSMKLGIPLPPTVRIKLGSTLNGKLIDKYEDRSHTYNRNYWNSLFCLNIGMSPASGDNFGAGHLMTKLKNGAALYATAMPYQGIANDASNGISVGRGSAAWSFEDINLNDPILHGALSGKLIYTAQNAVQTVYTSATKSWVASLVRVFNNNSGASIVIAEVGLAGYYAAVGVLVSRDVLGSTITVANGGQLTVTYTIEKVFPA